MPGERRRRRWHKTAKPDQRRGVDHYWLGVYYPSDYTIAVVDDLDHGRTCLRELVDSAISPSDVQLITGKEALRTHRRKRSQQSLVNKILRAFPTDEHSVQDECLANASEGTHFVAFRATHEGTGKARSPRRWARRDADRAQAIALGP